MLVEDTLRTCAEYLTVDQREDLAENWEQTYHSLVLWGKIRTLVRWIAEWEKVGVIQPGEWCTTTGNQVMEMMGAKHPEAWAATVASLDS